MAYKKNIEDTRESASIKILKVSNKKKKLLLIIMILTLKNIGS